MFGSTSNIGTIIGDKLGGIGSDMTYPQRFTHEFIEEAEFLEMTGNTGQVYIYKKTNFDNPHILRKLIKPSNVVVNLIGPRYTYQKIEQFEEVNVHIPRRLAMLAK